MNGEKYEREFSKLMQGDKDTIETLVTTMEDEDAVEYYYLKEHPFGVSGSAGAIGEDLVIYRGPFYLPIEVKSSKTDPKYFEKSEREQVQNYLEMAEKCNIPIAYAFRAKSKLGEKWSLSLLVEGERSINLPTLPTSNKGNRYLEFKQGKPLSKFLRELRK